MIDEFFSSSWYKVADLKPKLRNHVEIHRHQYRDELWYLLQDHAQEQSHLFSPESYFIIGMMNGNRTIQEIWDNLLTKLGDDCPTQDEVIQLFSQLHMSDVLQCHISPDVEELEKRYHKLKKKETLQRFLNPMAVKLPLFDPDRFLNWITPKLSIIPNSFIIFIYTLTLFSALVLGGIHWDELTEGVADRVLAPQNLLLLWFTFPLVKIMHEFGHGLAVKKWGGEVHEIGILFLVMMPVPYVNANASSAFRSKHKRMLVGATGMLIELFIASIALFFWILIEPSTLRAVLFNIMVIASVSTVLFNGNPLLRFDGYYILMDLLEIPNLASRSIKFLGYIAKKYLLGLHHTNTQENSFSIKSWLSFYGLASFLYRLFVAFVIIGFIASKFFVIGIILALWAFVLMVLFPLYKMMAFLIFNSQVQKQRLTTFLKSGAIVCLLGYLVFFLPIPYFTTSEGIIWVPDDAFVRTQHEGFIDQVIVAPGTTVKEGMTLLTLSNPTLKKRKKILEANIAELDARYFYLHETDYIEAIAALNEKQSVIKELDQIEIRLLDLNIKSRTKGIFILPDADDLPGRYLHRGDQIGYVLNNNSLKIRTIISQMNVDLVRNQSQEIVARLVHHIDTPLHASLFREIPQATDDLPSPALTRSGGGEIANNPGDDKGTKAFNKYFQFELLLHNKMPIDYFGERVYIRFRYADTPIWDQAYRKLKQYFLSLFNN